MKQPTSSIADASPNGKPRDHATRFADHPLSPNGNSQPRAARHDQPAHDAGTHRPLLPNSTQIPNVLLDLIMPFLRPSERAVLLYICRRTYGFRRDVDAISLDQFGVTSRNGF
jgi:hypothetical protein